MFDYCKLDAGVKLWFLFIISLKYVTINRIRNSL